RLSFTPRHPPWALSFSSPTLFRSAAGPVLGAGDRFLCEPVQLRIPGPGGVVEEGADLLEDRMHRRARLDPCQRIRDLGSGVVGRSEEHTSELQSRENLVCRLLLEK